MSEPITNLEDAVAALGALPMPVGPEPDADAVRLELFEEELATTARLRLALESAQRGRRELRSALRFSEPSRERWRAAAIEVTQERDALRARVAELEAAAEEIRFLHKDSPMGPCPVCVDADAMTRGGDGTVPYPCPTARLAGAKDVDPPSPTPEESAARWRRFIAPVQQLREDPHDSPLHHSYRVPRDLPETGGEAR